MEHALEYGASAAIDNKPNIFDIYAQETTKSLLHPLFQELTQHIQGRLPLPQSIVNNLDIVYLSFNLLIEWLSIKTNKASLCESYYGIARSTNNGKGLGSLQEIVTLVEVALIPYFWKKYKTASNYRRILPFIFAGYDFSNATLKLLYVFFQFSSPSLMMLLAGIRYVRDDSKATATNWRPFSLLGGVMLAIRFIQWWQENSEALSKDQRGDIPAPVSFLPAKGIPDNTSRCPICLGMLKRPIALPSGRVFCTSCLEVNDTFQKEGKCPVTLTVINKKFLRPLFVQAL